MELFWHEFTCSEEWYSKSLDSVSLSSCAGFLPDTIPWQQLHYVQLLIKQLESRQFFRSSRRSTTPKSSNEHGNRADYERLGAWARVLEPDQQIDRHTSHRIVPMEVL
jgi:hypothetical protein